MEFYWKVAHMLGIRKQARQNPYLWNQIIQGISTLNETMYFLSAILNWWKQWVLLDGESFPNPEILTVHVCKNNNICSNVTVFRPLPISIVDFSTSTFCLTSEIIVDLVITSWIQVNKGLMSDKYSVSMFDSFHCNYNSKTIYCFSKGTTTYTCTQQRLRLLRKKYLQIIRTIYWSV